MLFIAPLLLAVVTTDPVIGRVVNSRGAGKMTCATAFMPENRLETENWVAGFWTAWDMSQITKSEPLAAYSDLNGIVGEVEKICKDKPSSSLTFATLEARKVVKLRDAKPAKSGP